MIKIKDLTKKNIGQRVLYHPGFGDDEFGIIKSWNEEFIFVVYPGNNDSKKDHWDRYTAEATSPRDLTFM